jgi:hypothetical protein
MQSGVSSPFFVALPAAYRDMGISTGKKLTAEWETFAKISVQPGIQVIFSPFMCLSDADPKLQF